MIRHHFRRGLELKWRGRNFIIERRTEENNIQIRDTRSNDFLSFPQNELIDALFNGELEIIKNASEITSGKHLRFPDDLSLVSEERRETAKRRLKYVEKCITRKISTATQKIIEPIIFAVAKEINDSCPPSWSSVYRWLREYLKSEGDIRALLPKHRKGNTIRRFGKSPSQKFNQQKRELSSEAAKIVEEVIQENFLTKQKLSVQATYDSLLIRLAEINRFRAAENKLPVPHPDSLYTVINNLDEYEKDAARLGKRIADQKHLQRGIGPRPSRPLERGENDHTKVNLFVVDEIYCLPLGRPWITSLIDKYSSMVLGRYVSFEPPSSNSILKCLLHAIRPKTYLRQQFPNIQNDWECYGLVESISNDNGMAELSNDYADSLLQLGTNIDYSPVRQPWYKSAIERFFGVQNQKLLHRLPGTTFSNILEKADYDPKKNAVISFSAFLELLDTWIVDIYSQEIQRGYEHTGPQKIPAVAWREGIAKFPPALPPKDLDLDILLRMIEYRTVDQAGIELFSLRYNSPHLGLLRRELKGEKVMVKYDSADLSLIYVADVKMGTYIPVPALDQNYTKNLSLYQHNLIKRFTREHLKSKVNSESLIKAKAYVQEIVRSEIYKTKSTRTRVQIARFEGINSAEKSTFQPVPEDHRKVNFTPLPMLPPASEAEAEYAENSDEATTPVSPVSSIADENQNNIVNKNINKNKSKTLKKPKKGKSSPKNEQSDTKPFLDKNKHTVPEVIENIENLETDEWGGSFDLPNRK
jgi:putative transposase